MQILGIETSCDETAVALYDTERGLRGHLIYSQLGLHQPYGGVIPELASRDHLRKLAPLTQQLLAEHQCTWQDLGGIAYTAGPGLIGALLVGATFAKSLGVSLEIPALGVHHLESHLLAPFLSARQPRYPFLALLVSGGHTLLAEVKQLGDYHIIGETVDDSAGEAFDKTAKLLGLGYPGGPAIAALAQQGHPHRFTLPQPLRHSADLRMSFSGLKTSVRLAWEKSDQSAQTKADIAYAFQDTVVGVLVSKCLQALEQTGLRQLVLAGGVSANQQLRAQLHRALSNEVELFYPEFEFCTDNAAMVAYTGAMRLQTGEREDAYIRARSRWRLGSNSSSL